MTPDRALEIVEELGEGDRGGAAEGNGGWLVDIGAKEAFLEYFRLR